MTEPTPAAPGAPMFPITEGDLWRWQLETMTELAAFLRKHGPGTKGALPAVRWHVQTGLHAVARLFTSDGLVNARRDRRAVLAAYAEALGSEVTSVDLGRGDTDYRVAGVLGERGRVKVTLIATIRAEDPEQAAPGEPQPPAAALVHAVTPIGMQRARRGVGPGPRCGQSGPTALSAREVTCPRCRALLDGAGDGGA